MVQRTVNATYQDLLDAPEHSRAELIDGELFLHASPRLIHQNINAALQVDLGSAFWRGRDGPGGWIIITNPDVHLAVKERVLVPDLAGWKRENAPDFSNDDVSTSTTPDWVCEILSPTTRRHDLLRKRPLYAEHGVPWLWLIDPDARLLEIYQREANGYFLAATHDADEGPIRAPPFDAIELHLKLIWPQPK